jgi:hypothetical protein
MFESKESKAALKWSTVTTICLSVMGFLGTQLYGVLSDKLATVDENEKTLIIMKSKLNSDEAQWRIIQEQNTKISALSVEIEVLERLVTTYADDAHHKVVTLNVQGFRNEMGPSKSAANDDFEGDGSDGSDGGDDFGVEVKPPPKPLIKDYQKILEDVDKLDKEDVKQFKNRAIQMQKR